MGEKGDYCAFTKTVEHLGDRWSLVILRELTLHGTRGFNALADSMPGISRSVLAARLKKLEDMELIARDRSAGRGVPGYQLAHAGRELRPILYGLWQWSLRFVPEDPAMAERDPDIVIRWLGDRVDTSSLPDRAVVLDLDVSGTGTRRFWLVLERGVAPSICIEDPTLGEERYVYIEADVRALYPIARGMRNWSAAISDGSVQVFGSPQLIAAMPNWFNHGEGGVSSRPGRAVRQSTSGLAVEVPGEVGTAARKVSRQPAATGA